MLKLTIFFLLLCPIILFAQLGMGKPDDIREFINRKKVLLLKEGYSQGVVKQFSKKKPEIVSKHIAAIDAYNKTLYEVAKNHTLFKGKIVEIKDGLSIMSIPKEERKNYIVVYGTNLQTGANPSKHKMIVTSDIPGAMVVSERPGELGGEPTRFMFFLLENPTKMGLRPLYMSETTSAVPNYVDIKTAFDLTRKYFHYRLNSNEKGAKQFDLGLKDESSKGISSIKDYEILVSKYHIDPDVDLPDFITVLEESEYVERIEEGKEELAYWYPLTRPLMHVILSATSGKLLYYYRPSAGKAYFGNYVKSKYLIDDTMLKDLILQTK